MSWIPRPEDRIGDVRIADDVLTVGFADGRSVSVPLAWYPRLLRASAGQRTRWRISGGGFGIHWPEIDEDLGAEGLLKRLPAPGVAKGG